MSATSGAAGRLPAQELSESACRLTGCEHPELLATLVVLVGCVAALLVTGVVLRRLDEAREAVAAERARATAEMEAFETFTRRVESLDRTPSRPDGGMPRPSRVGDTGPPDELRAVRRAYRETVMSVSHHDEEFGETLTEGMAAEFSPEVAAAVANGGRLTPAIHGALVRGSRQARDRRERILTHLDEERDAIERAAETLRPAVETAREVQDRASEAPLPTLVADADRLDYHERSVESLLADRQQSIHEADQDRETWYEYVYGPLGTPHPVLSAGTRALSALDDARDDVARGLA
ncbi:MAG: hypothetical protein ABEI75_03695 [Halobaculum sp.]